MKVTIINPEQAVKLFHYWGEFASVCYDTRNVKPEKIGKHCLKSGHFSGSRSQYIIFKIEDCPRDTVDQLVRHEQGACKNVRSFRYVAEANFHCALPTEVQGDPELVRRWAEHMDDTKALYADIQQYVYEKTGSKERANEQARKCLPIHTDTALCIGLDIEALIHLCHTRLCVRTEEEHRKLVLMIRAAVLELLPELDGYLVPQCEYLLWCPEGKSCGAHPRREYVAQLIAEDRKRRMNE